MNSGNASIFPCGGISVRVAAQRKGVSVSTIRRWIKAGKLFAKKVGRCYCIATDELFAKAEKYQQARHYKNLVRENLELKKELREMKEFCRELSIAYDGALERSEDLQREVAKWRMYDLIERSPDVLMRIYREYRNKHSGNNPEQWRSQWEYHEAWERDENNEEHLELLPLLNDSIEGEK